MTYWTSECLAELIWPIPWSGQARAALFVLFIYIVLWSEFDTFGKHQALSACFGLCTYRMWQVSFALFTARALTTCRRPAIFWKYQHCHVSWNKFRYFWHLGSCWPVEVCISVLEQYKYCAVSNTHVFLDLSLNVSQSLIYLYWQHLMWS